MASSRKRYFLFEAKGLSVNITTRHDNAGRDDSVLVLDERPVGDNACSPLEAVHDLASITDVDELVLFHAQDKL